METPISPDDATAQVNVKLHRASNGTPGSEQREVEKTPIPTRREACFPRIRGYDIVCVIGSGGMGIVYEARHRELNRRVAIKMLRGEALADPEFQARFRAEAEAMAQLQHPNVVQVFEVGCVEAQFGEAHPSPFIALEFVDGGSLIQLTDAPQPPREAARMVEVLARAAHAAHSLGIVHRDLKPANVLMTRDGVLKIADFGIAKQVDAERAVSDRLEKHFGTNPTGAYQLNTRAGLVMGTPEYIAPEQMEARSVSPSIDVYALGVILYELLTARVPFQGATFSDTMLLAMREEPVSPRRLQPKVPRDLETICLKCLEKTPGKRYESAEALADDLARWASGLAIRARPLGTVGRTVRWARRNPAVAMLSVAIFFVASAGMSGVFWKWDEARTNAIRAADNARTADENARKAEAAAEKAQEAADKERWERYRLSVFAASSALRLHDVNSARGALEQAPEEHRDWIWKLLRAQLDRSHDVLPGRTTVNCIARFTPDGGSVVIRDGDDVVRVWSLKERRESTPVRSEAKARTIALSDDGKTVAYSTDAHEIVLCDAATGHAHAILRGHADGIDTLCFGPDGTRLISGSGDRTVRLWDVQSGRSIHVFTAPREFTRPFVFSPDLRLVAASCEGATTPRIWDRESGREIACRHRHEDRVRAMRFSPTGDRLVTVESFPSNVLRLWDVATGKLLATMAGHKNQVNHVEFSTDGKLLASCSTDRTLGLWDLTKELTGKELPPRHFLRGHAGGVNHATFSPDGTRVTSGSIDRTLRHWDVNTGMPIAVLRGHGTDLVAALHRPDGEMIVSCSSDGAVRLWDVREVERDYAICGHKKFVYGVACHPDGVRIASVAWDGTARVWNATTSQQLLLLDHRNNAPGSRWVTSIAYHPTGQFLATLARDDSLRLWDAESGQLLHRWNTPGGNWRDSRVSFSSKGDLVAAGSHDGGVRVWNVDTRSELGVVARHVDGVRDVAFSPAGRWLASAGDASDRTVRVTDVTRKEETRILRGHETCIYALAWNRQGTLLASGSTDGVVRFWDVATWQEAGVLKNSVSLHCLAFTPDGKSLTVGCADNLIRVWNTSTRQMLAELSGHDSYVHSLAFSPDGTRLVSGSGDGTIRTWDALSPAERFRQAQGVSPGPGKPAAGK